MEDLDSQSFNGREIVFIPDRLIEEPIVFRGLTDTEVVGLSLAGIAFWIPASVLILLPFGHGLFGVAIGFGLAIVTILVIGKYLQMLKRRMPDGLHIVYLKKQAQQKYIFFDYGYIETSQSWDIKRNTQITKKIVESEE